MAGFTRLLQQFADGAVDADATAITALYEEVRRLARSFLRNERAGHTLVPTALANEAWLRLFGVALAPLHSGSMTPDTSWDSKVVVRFSS